MKNRNVNRIFNELDAYRDFCVEYGYQYNEAHLYKRNTPYGLFERTRRGAPVVNQWEEDAKHYDRQPVHRAVAI